MERLAASPAFVGIDVSKDRLDVHLCPSGEAFAVLRDGKGLEQLVNNLRKLGPALIVLEATGGFEIRSGSVRLNSLTGSQSGSPALNYAAARSGWVKYSWSGVRRPRLE